jgi:predicted nucleic acid-binding protein
MRYWDSSALVALHVKQSATRSVRSIYDSDPAIVTWVLSDVEIRSGIARLWRDEAISDDGAQESIARIESFWESVNVVSSIDAVRARAKRFLGSHALSAADAMQLGAALTAAYDDPVGWEFVCLDRRLCQAARREGFRVLP